MKNKHLVFLFLLTLLVGLAVRKAPWKNAIFFQSNLLKMDTSQVQQIQIACPGKPNLTLVRTENGWSAEQQERSTFVQASASQQLLAVLADLRSIRRVKSTRLDTLGFGVSTSIEVSVFMGDKLAEKFDIGWETIENSHSATYVHLPAHQGTYLASGHFRQIFSQSLMDFRDKTATRFDAAEVESFSVERAGMPPEVFIPNRENGLWVCAQPEIRWPADSAETWLQWCSKLQNLPFHDLFDESRADERLFAKVVFHLKKEQAPVVLKIFHAMPSSPPELIPRPKTAIKNQPFALHCSQNPTNYFALPDTTFALRLCRLQ
jgi:hypothetical protein